MFFPLIIESKNNAVRGATAYWLNILSYFNKIKIFFSNGVFSSEIMYRFG